MSALTFMSANISADWRCAWLMFERLLQDSSFCHFFSLTNSRYPLQQYSYICQWHRTESRSISFNTVT
jgi:hypothetical protein